MSLDAQIQLLIEHAPQDGVTGQVVAAIAPGLKLLAEKLRHSQYYILQNLQQDWVLTTLSSRARPSVEKRVVYAFPTIQDASSSSTEFDPQMIAVPIPVTHILFQLIALSSVDSIIFLETPPELGTGVEVQRQDLQDLIQTQLQQNLSAPSTLRNQLPPDIA